MAASDDLCVKCGEEEWGLHTLTCCKRKIHMHCLEYHLGDGTRCPHCQQTLLDLMLQEFTHDSVIFTTPCSPFTSTIGDIFNHGKCTSGISWNRGEDSGCQNDFFSFCDILQTKNRDLFFSIA